MKRRFVESYPLQKLFEVYVMADIDRHAAQSDAICENLAAILPQAKLVFLKGVGHMPHHAAPEAVAAAIDELASPRQTALVPQRETRALVVARA